MVEKLVVVLAEKWETFVDRHITSKKTCVMYVHMYTMQRIRQWAVGVLILLNKVIPFFHGLG